jgi:hypothetical protein
MAQITKAIEQAWIEVDKATYQREASDVLCESVIEIVAHKPSMHMQITMVSRKLGPLSAPRDLARLKVTTVTPGVCSVYAHRNAQRSFHTYQQVIWYQAPLPRYRRDIRMPQQ